MGLFGKSKKAAAEPQGAQATGMPVQGAQAQPSGMAAQGMQTQGVQTQGVQTQVPNAATFGGVMPAGDAAVQDAAQVIGAVGTVPAGAASAFETPGAAMGAVQPQDMVSSQPVTGVAAAQQFQDASQTPQAFQSTQATQAAQAEPAEQPAAQADPQPAVRRTQSLSELAAAREQLMAKLGESVYPLLKEVPEVQIGREDLFSRIAKLDEQVAKAEARAAYEQETRRLQELQRRQAQERAQREEEERQAQAQAQQQAQQQAQAQQAFAEQQPLAQQQEPAQQAFASQTQEQDLAAQQAQFFAQQTVSQPQTSASYPGFGQQQGAQQQAGVAGQQQGMQQQAAEQPPVQQYRCPRCGNPVDQHAPFCGYCGCLFQTSEQA